MAHTGPRLLRCLCFGFSKCRWLATRSRSLAHFSSIATRAFSLGSPFFSLISVVNLVSLPLRLCVVGLAPAAYLTLVKRLTQIDRASCQPPKTAKKRPEHPIFAWNASWSAPALIRAPKADKMSGPRPGIFGGFTRFIKSPRYSVSTSGLGGWPGRDACGPPLTALAACLGLVLGIAQSHGWPPSNFN